MGRRAEHVYTDNEYIQRLESLVEALPDNGRVRLLLKDGSRCDGVVSVRPSVQVFRDSEGNEGLNATVRLERPEAPDWHRDVWLDDIVRVEHLDSIMIVER